MKYLIALVLFAPIIYLALRQKKWYLCLLFAFFPILPDSFAVELSASLPLLTGARVLLLLVLAIWVCKRTRRPFLYLPISLVVYTVCNLLISVINFRYGFAEINSVFRLVLERFLLVLIVRDLIRNEKEFDTCVDFMIYSSVSVSVIGVLQTVLKLDVSTVFHLMDARVEGSIVDRMGTTRAYGTFDGNAILFGCYCAFMILVILYQYEKRRGVRYLVFLAAVLCGLLCSMTRSAIMALGIVLVLMLFIRRWSFFKRYVRYLPLVVPVLLAVYLFKPEMLDTVTELVKSCLKVLGFDVELSSAFGVNSSDAAYSRNVQWTAIRYMLGEGEGLFGYGYNAFIRGKLFYFFRQFGRWTAAPALDVGFVSIATEKGLAGLAVQVAFIVSVFFGAWNKSHSYRHYDFYKLTEYMMIFYIIINIASAFNSAGAVWLFFALYYTRRRLDRDKAADKSLQKDGLNV